MFTLPVYTQTVLESLKVNDSVLTGWFSFFFFEKKCVHRIELRHSVNWCQLKGLKRWQNDRALSFSHNLLVVTFQLKWRSFILWYNPGLDHKTAATGTAIVIKAFCLLSVETIGNNGTQNFNYSVDSSVFWVESLNGKGIIRVKRLVPLSLLFRMSIQKRWYMFNFNFLSYHEIKHVKTCKTPIWNWMYKIVIFPR